MATFHFKKKIISIEQDHPYSFWKFEKEENWWRSEHLYCICSPPEINILAVTNTKESFYLVKQNIFWFILERKGQKLKSNMRVWIKRQLSRMLILCLIEQESEPSWNILCVSNRQTLQSALKFVAGGSLVFSRDFAVSEMDAIGLGEACAMDLYKALVGARTLTIGAEMRMWTAWCVSLCFFGASKESVKPWELLCCWEKVASLF